jgi:hypothetical protein
VTGTRFTASNGWYVEDEDLYNDQDAHWARVGPDFYWPLGRALIEYGAYCALHDALSALLAGEA